MKQLTWPLFLALMLFSSLSFAEVPEEEEEGGVDEEVARICQN